MTRNPKYEGARTTSTQQASPDGVLTPGEASAQIEKRLNDSAAAEGSVLITRQELEGWRHCLAQGGNPPRAEYDSPPHTEYVDGDDVRNVHVPGPADAPVHVEQSLPPLGRHVEGRDTQGRDTQPLPPLERKSRHDV